MCCLFGILDYGHSLSAPQKNHILSVLSKACEARGTDATGIAYNTRSAMKIYKRPLPAHRMRFRLPNDVHYVMGHTRLSTQGDRRRNRNNHPFKGYASGHPFALAHNGVLNNDRDLRKKKKLPATNVETDSYIAVQLIERSGTLSFDILKQMAEQLNGTFTITVMDREDHLYIVKGNNPLCLYHWPKLGLYLYASIKAILKQALQSIRIKLGWPEEIPIDSGDILCIDPYGQITQSRFDTAKLYYDTFRFCWPGQRSFWAGSAVYDGYISELKSVSRAFGYSPEEIDELLNDGFSPEEIEEYLYSMEV